MVNFEVNHKVASFKEVCLGVVMVLGDKAQTYPPPPKKKKIEVQLEIFGMYAQE